MSLASAIACSRSSADETRQDGAEQLSSREIRVGGRVAHDSRRDEIAVGEIARRRNVADVHALGVRSLEHSPNGIARGRADHRADGRCRIRHRTERKRRDAAAQSVEEVAFHFPRDDDAARRRALLSGVAHRAGGGERSGEVEIRVAHHDGDVLSAHFRLISNVPSRGGSSDRRADLSGAGEAHRLHVVGVDQPRAHDFAGAEQDIEHALGNSRGRGALGEERRRLRRRLSRLEHDRVSERQRGRGLP